MFKSQTEYSQRINSNMRKLLFNLDTQTKKIDAKKI